MVPLKPRLFFAACGRVFWSLITGGPVFAPQDVADDRMTECERRNRSCYDGETGQCKMCSCFVAIKTSLATEKCPLGVWGRWFPWTRGLRKRKITQ